MRLLQNAACIPAVEGEGGGCAGVGEGVGAGAGEGCQVEGGGRAVRDEGDGGDAALAEDAQGVQPAGEGGAFSRSAVMVRVPPSRLSWLAIFRPSASTTR